MKAGIISSSNKNIDSKYLEIAKEVSDVLIENDYDLTFGGCSTSMMGVCYNEFKSNNRNILTLTTKKYENDLVNLEYGDKIICDTTFDLKKNFFENSDIIVVLPGGIGTFSELFSFIEENRSNDQEKHIEIYDEDGYYLPFIEMLQIMIMNKFNDADILDYFKVSHDLDEFKEHLNMYKQGKRF